MAPSWKPAKTDGGNYGAAVSAAAHARNAARQHSVEDDNRTEPNPTSTLPGNFMSPDMPALPEHQATHQQMRGQ